jgi:glycosyltransferase involved in cell wall biosynthesis
MKLAVVIMTYNEAKHLDRCFASLLALDAEVHVIDCFSSDDTLTIARRSGAIVHENAWVNHAEQFNWGLTQLPNTIDWVLRLDADEYLTPALVDEINKKLSACSDDVGGISIPRRINFLGKLIKYGGVNKIHTVRLFRAGQGRCENRWMDEHIVVQGKLLKFKNELIDENLNPISWWVEKHNGYASREAVELLNLRYGFMPYDSIAKLSTKSQASLKRWVKENLYSKAPSGLRAFAYFVYRYILLGGFLDGSRGFAFHFLQGFWYRYLVDIKISEVERSMQSQNLSVQEAIYDVLKIRV